PISNAFLEPVAGKNSRFVRKVIVKGGEVLANIMESGLGVEIVTLPCLHV
ncbi:hypothetical protein NPIL_674421, partial [Nephila pilipes]